MKIEREEKEWRMVENRGEEKLKKERREGKKGEKEESLPAVPVLCVRQWALGLHWPSRTAAEEGHCRTQRVSPKNSRVVAHECYSSL